MVTTPQTRDTVPESPSGQPRPARGPRLHLLTPDEALHDATIRRDWQSLLDRANPLYRVFASPTLYEHENRVNGRRENRVAILRDETGRVIGLCPIVLWELTVPFIVRRRILARMKLQAATILGCEPLVPAEPELYGILFEGLLEQLPWCDCVYIDSMPVDRFAANYFYEGGRRKGSFLVYPRHPERREFLCLEPGRSMDEFLQGKHKRTRNTLKRRVRKLRETGRGQLECCRVETPEQVEAFYPAAVDVARRSWQDKALGRPEEHTALYRESLLSAARLGCLRAYLLKCGGEPCAFVIGYQDGDVLQFEQTAYAQEWHVHSPGTVLYFMMLEDLYGYRPPGLVNFGIGINPHKRLFSNRSAFDTSIYVLRPTVRNRLRFAAHGLFTSGVRLAKRLLKRKAVEVPGEDDD
jgi:hypothetical protein